MAQVEVAFYPTLGTEVLLDSHSDPPGNPGRHGNHLSVLASLHSVPFQKSLFQQGQS